MKRVICFCCLLVLVILSVSCESSDTRTYDIRITDKVENLNVSWSSGNVEIKHHDKNYIEVKAVTNQNRLEYTCLNGTLAIKATNGSFIQLFNFGKKEENLTVYIPTEICLNNLKVSVSSADVYTDSIDATSIDFSSSSGNIHSAVDQCNSIQISSSSGKINVVAQTINSASFDSSSGNMNLTFETLPKNAKISSSSGDIVIKVPQNPDLTLKVSTSSGEFRHAISLSYSGKVYKSGNGENNMSISTSSGDITLR